MEQNNLQIQKYKYNELKDKSNIPEEYWKYEIKDYNSFDEEGKENLKKKNAYLKTINYIKNIEENLRNGKGLYYFGQRYSQCGLSLLGTYVLRSALEHFYKSLYIEFTSFVLDLTHYDSDINIYYDIDYLMLDSIDSSRSLKNAKVHDTFADILSYRRSRKKPIIFCSYQHYKLFSTEYCKSIESYVENYCEFIDISNDKEIKFTLYELIILLEKQKNNDYKDPATRTLQYSPEDIYNLIKGYK